MMLRRALVLWTTLALLAGPALAQSGQNRVEVGSERELLDALGSAGKGRVIALRPGTYRDMVIDGRKPEGEVRVVAAKPSEPPVINGLVITDSQNIVLEGLRFEGAPSDKGTGILVDVQKSRGIQIRRSLFTPAANTGDARRLRALNLIQVEDFRLADSRISGGGRGIVLTKSRRVAIEHNLFENLLNDGIGGAECDTVLISQNRFLSVKTPEEALPNFIQFWTRGADGPSANLSVRFNVMQQEGPSPVGGIVLGNESNIPYENVTITGNLIVLGSPRGISVYGANGVKVEGNVLIDRVGSNYNNSIRIHKAKGGSATNNLAVAFGLSQVVNVDLRRNTTIPRLDNATRLRLAERVTRGLASKDAAPTPIQAGHSVQPEHRAAGPRAP